MGLCSYTFFIQHVKQVYISLFVKYYWALRSAMKSSAIFLSLALVVLGLVASSLATRHQPQKVTCAKDKDDLADQLVCQNFTFDKDYRDHLDYAASSINYCEFDGTFVFYSEIRFGVLILNII